MHIRNYGFSGFIHAWMHWTWMKNILTIHDVQKTELAFWWNALASLCPLNPLLRLKFLCYVPSKNSSIRFSLPKPKNSTFQHFNFTFIASVKCEYSYLIGLIPACTICLHFTINVIITMTKQKSSMNFPLFFSGKCFVICFCKYLMSVKTSHYQTGKVNIEKCLASVWAVA